VGILLEAAETERMPTQGATSATVRAAGQIDLSNADENALTRRSVSAWIEARALFIVGVAAVITLSLAGIPRHLTQDGWLALIAGRSIAAHGIPQHDYFAHMTYGVRWVDQQWLAQLLIYEVERIGGLQLMTVLYVFVTGFAFAGAVAAARRLGAEDLHVLMMLPPGAFFYLATAVSIRTQGLAYPLFVGTLWLLASEMRARTPNRRVYWVLPMLVLWANLHGSVTLGVGLAVLYGAAVLVMALRARGLAGTANLRGWTFLVMPPLTLLATPYGTAILHYYRVTLFNSQFGRVVSEWKPATSIAIFAVPLFLLIGAVVVTLIRARSRGDVRRPDRALAFDAVVLLALAIGAVTAIRNITWFGLAVVILMPAAITRMKRGAEAPLRRARVNRMLAIAMIAVTALAAVAVLGRPDSWFTSTYPAKAVPVLRGIVADDRGARIFADIRYADWLIWQDPRLFSGRVAYDTSLELLTASQIQAISDPAANSQAGPSGVLAPYRIWMLYPGNKAMNRQLLRRSGVRVVSRSKKVIIATHDVSRASAGARA
jgi:hypothetical protein